MSSRASAAVSLSDDADDHLSAIDFGRIASLVEGEAMRMRPVAQVDLPPGETLVMAPGGGLHLMLEGLREPLRKGATAPITLRFERAGEVEIEAEVVRPGGKHH